MWKYISGVPKVVEEKKKEKNPKAACDSKGSKEYEKNRSRKFSAKWQVGRPWLQHDQDKGMICKWCIEDATATPGPSQPLFPELEEEEDEVLFREKADDNGEDEGVISDYESEAEMSEEMVLEKLEKFLL